MNELVSVCIISFNSSGTVIETLESIKKQTYPNIELVISDDCSLDDTVPIIQKWIAENKKYGLSDIKFLTHEKNGGTCKNLNDCIRTSSGKWIKILAADDMLVPNAIEEFVLFSKQQNCHFSICDCNILCDSTEVKRKLEKTYRYFFNTVKYSFEKKQRKILFEYTYPGPCYFFSREMYDSVKGFDETYDLAEEWPFVFHAIKSGYDIKALNMKLVDYRFQNTSLSHSVSISKRLLDGNILFYNKERKPALIKKGMFLRVLHQNYIYYIQKKYNGKNAGVLLKYVSPYSLFEKLSYFLKSK